MYAYMYKLIGQFMFITHMKNILHATRLIKHKVYNYISREEEKIEGLCTHKAAVAIKETRRFHLEATRTGPVGF